MLVFTDIRGLNLESGLKRAIAAIMVDISPADIPLSLGLRCQGLGYRSAIALKQAANQAQAPPLLAQQYLTKLVAPVPPPELEQYWCYQGTATTEGWLEFCLEPMSLKAWMDLCQDHFATLPPRQFPDKLGKTPLTFRFQYLQVRCRQLTELADSCQPTGPQQWFFERLELPSWEQTLLDCLVRFSLCLAQGDFSERLLFQLGQAFWDFHRYCPLFAWQRTQPRLFAHYRRWLQLIHVLFVACLENIYGVQ
ncbi:MAG: hypothetical protein HC799_11030, partial [Limnothrix sp. RL_2_0]|nr:hypothetical protein [Limnothrix sp. RL_2_0]